MGYDLTRFTGVIDEEFLCTICTMVLEIPLQSPCDHLFCSECIEEWLTINESCPVDRSFLASDCLKPPARYFLNMLDKLDIRCSFRKLTITVKTHTPSKFHCMVAQSVMAAALIFCRTVTMKLKESEGCNQVFKLEHLKNHLNTCEYSTNQEIVCDKGCNLKLKRCEYKFDCFIHLSDHLRSQDEKMSNLTQALNDQFMQVVTELKGEVNHLQAKVSKLGRDVSSQRKHITKLINELNRLRPLHEDIHKVSGASNTVIQSPPAQWQKCYNMNIAIDETNILEFGHYSGTGFAQSFRSLNQASHCFQTQILSNCSPNCIAIGLTQKDHPTDVPPGHSDGSIGYRCCGKLYFDKCESVASHACKVDDILECGITFPKNFVNDGSRSVVVYFSKNGISFLKKLIRMPVDGLFPTVYMFDSYVAEAVKIKYFDCKNSE